MKLWKNFVSVLLIGVSISFICFACSRKSETSSEKVSDGYVFTASEDVVGKVQDNSDYGVTFVDLDGKTTADADTIRKALSDPSKHSTVEGKATKVEKNKLKLITASNIGVDLKRPVAVFWGLNAQKIKDLLSGGLTASDKSCDCGGIPDMKQVTCHDPASVLCCGSCP